MRLCQLLALVVIVGTTGVACEKRDQTSRGPSSSEPDNTARNERDRSGATMTPPDQQESELDLSLTKRIRQAVTDADGLSVNARNFKIISSGGRVTLRGPVETGREKQAIAAIARETAGVTRVDDQLEVATP
jgi:osmotically-inducible protein OsmY